MLGLGRLFSSFRDLYKEINPATLNGAVDVIVVEQPDGSFTCSPFYVRFGKMGVLRSREKLVDITINDEPVSLHMKLAESGEAYFVEDTVEEHELPLHLATSPLPTNGAELMAEGLAMLKKQSAAETLSSDGELQDVVVSSPSDSPPAPLSPITFNDPEKTPTVENIGEKEKIKPGTVAESPPPPPDLSSTLKSLPPALDRRHLKKLTRLRRENEIFRQRSLHSRSASWHGGSLPNLLMSSTTPTSAGNSFAGDLLSHQKSTGQYLKHASLSQPGQRKFHSSKSFVAQQELRLDFIEDWNEINNSDQSPRPKLNSAPHTTLVANSTTSRKNFELFGLISLSLCGGLDRNGVLSVTDEMFKNKQITYEQFNADPNLLFSHDLVIRWNEKYYSYGVAIPMLISLLVFDQSLSDSSVADLITKHQLKSMINEQRNEVKAVDAYNQAGRTSSYSYSSWFSWRRASSMEPTGVAKVNAETKNLVNGLEKPSNSAMSLTSEKEDELSVELSEEIKDAHDLMSYDERGALSDSELDQAFGRPTTSSRYRKSLYLNSDQLKMLKLKPNQANKATFSVTTKYQGTSACECEIFLWKWYDKIVISDIDGTITKSDVLGHIMPIVGRQWEHSNIADLYTRIVDNGYRVMYLTARAIGQSQWTKDYLKSIKQDKKSLPDGPLQLSPTSLFNAFHSEVIEKKPEIFKMKCLRDIKSLFPEHTNPYYAGFGNKSTDEYSYRASGVPTTRIFTINPLGELRFADKDVCSSYQHVSDLADHIFPPLPNFKSSKDSASSHSISSAPSPPGRSVIINSKEDFTNFSYWRHPVSNVPVDVSKFAPEKLPKSSRKDSTASTKKK